MKNTKHKLAAEYDLIQSLRAIYEILDRMEFKSDVAITLLKS